MIREPFYFDTTRDTSPDSIGTLAARAIVLEASAHKAGNVHPAASFANMSFEHFVRGSEAIGESIDCAYDRGLGEITLRAATEMMRIAGVNTGLGTILLVVPIAKAVEHLALNRSMRRALQTIMLNLTAHDSARVYDAIRVCNPGGIGNVSDMDVHAKAPDSLLDAMHTASSWDDVALQYCNGFEQVMKIAKQLHSMLERGIDWPDAIRCVQIEVLSERIDSLIARKLGGAAARDVCTRSKAVLNAGPYGSTKFEHAWQEFDAYLRSDGNRRNPGTTADLIAAAIYLVLLEPSNGLTFD